MAINEKPIESKTAKLSAGSSEMDGIFFLLRHDSIILDVNLTQLLLIIEIFALKIKLEITKIFRHIFSCFTVDVN